MAVLEATRIGRAFDMQHQPPGLRVLPCFPVSLHGGRIGLKAGITRDHLFFTGRNTSQTQHADARICHQPEKYHFNNFAELKFIIDRDKINPILDVTFDGQHILNGDIVSGKPQIVVQLHDENKFLALNDTSKFNRAKRRYVTAFDLYQYQSFSAGLDVNLGYLNNHDLKYSITLNAGARLGITSVRDSLTTTSQNTITKTGQVSEYSINTFQFYPTLIFAFLPEERFNLSLKEQLIYIRALNSGVQELTFDKIDNTKVKLRNSSWLNMLELLMTIQVNPNSKLFGRVRFNSVLNNAQTNFAQVQVGYSTFILGGKP